MKTTRAAVEEALRRTAVAAEGEHAERAALQMAFLEQLPDRVDTEVLASEEMWR